jgi:hypothetical protein
MRAMPAVELLELPQRAEQVVTVPDESAVQEFVAAGLHPPCSARNRQEHAAPSARPAPPGAAALRPRLGFNTCSPQCEPTRRPPGAMMRRTRRVPAAYGHGALVDALRQPNCS